MKTTLSQKLTPRLIDQLGSIQSQIAELRQKEQRIKELLVNSGVDELEGTLFRAVVIRSEVKTIDYKGLIVKLKPSHQMMTAYTRINERTSVKVSSRKTA